MADPASLDAGSDAGFESFFYASRDGLSLFGRDYGGDPSRLPVVCLPGLTRSSRDFHELALQLSGPTGRRVLAFDFRGRGRSARDPSGKTYLPTVEAQDVLDGMKNRGVAKAAFIGTSRGGIVTMILGGMAPAMIGAAVLNDIGNRIETAGLLRIKGYVGRPLPAIGWDEAARLLEATMGQEFPAFGPEDWARQARLTFADQGGLPVLDYDPLLAAGFSALTQETPPADLSAAFATLSAVPVLVLRGETSQLLARETVAAMRAVHPGVESFEVPGQGHPPELRGDVALRIAAFLDRVAPIGA